MSSWHEDLCSAEETDLDPELGCLSLMRQEDPDEEEEWAMSMFSARMSGRRILNS